MTKANLEKLFRKILKKAGGAEGFRPEEITAFRLFFHFGCVATFNTMIQAHQNGITNEVSNVFIDLKRQFGGFLFPVDDENLINKPIKNDKND